MVGMLYAYVSTKVSSGISANLNSHNSSTNLVFAVWVGATGNERPHAGCRAVFNGSQERRAAYLLASASTLAMVGMVWQCVRRSTLAMVGVVYVHVSMTVSSGISEALTHSLPESCHPCG